MLQALRNAPPRLVLFDPPAEEDAGDDVSPRASPAATVPLTSPSTALSEDIWALKRSHQREIDELARRASKLTHLAEARRGGEHSSRIWASSQKPTL